MQPQPTVTPKDVTDTPGESPKEADTDPLGISVHDVNTHPAGVYSSYKAETNRLSLEVDKLQKDLSCWTASNAANADTQGVHIDRAYTPGVSNGHNGARPEGAEGGGKAETERLLLKLTKLKQELVRHSEISVAIAKVKIRLRTSVRRV